MKKFLLLLFSFITFGAHGQSVLLPKFNKQTMRFIGDPVSQAKMLIRPVMIQAHLGDELKTLPDILQKALSGMVAPPDVARLKLYLKTNKLNVAELGGDVDQPLSKNINGTTANYFIIHDTSSPLYDGAFPTDIDSDSWKYNNLKLPKKVVAHVFVNRAGVSVTQNSFNIPWRATKFENTALGTISRGNFIHVELIQPRRTDPKYKQKDAIAPEPGFTKLQFKRLALLYIIASSRKKEWLIPAFHACLDQGLDDGHDDPQHFDLDLWAQQLQAIFTEINAQKIALIPPLRTINCQGLSKTINQVFSRDGNSWVRTVSLPSSGKFTIEGHYVTKSDVFEGGYPVKQGQNLKNIWTIRF